MKRQIVLIASLVAGLIAALLTSAYISTERSKLAKERNELRKNFNEIEAVSVSRTIPKDTPIAEKDLKPFKTLKHKSEKSDDIIKWQERGSIIGKEVSHQLDPNKPLQWIDIKGLEKSIKPSDGIPAKGGYRAVSINVTGAAAVSGMIRKGDFVDVIATFNFPDDEGRIKRGDPVTCTILQRVSVLAVGNQTQTSKFGSSINNSSFSTVTLTVTPREAEILAFAEQIKGRLMLTLRNPNDISIEKKLPTVEYSEIRAQLEDLNKKRNDSFNSRSR